MKTSHLIAFGLLLTLFWGCAQPKLPSNLVPDPDLPALEDILTITDRNAVAFEWKRVDDPQVGGYLLYRSQGQGPLAQVGGVPNRYATHYTDRREIKPDQQYLYRLSYFTDDGRESQLSSNISVRTLPAPPAVSFIQSVEGLPRMGKLVFRPHANERISHYTIERRDLTRREWRQVGKLQGRLHAEFIDSGLEDNMHYEYRIIAHTHDGLSSTPSEVVTTLTRPLPPTPTGQGATTDLPRSIRVQWERLDGDEAGHYRLYGTNHERSGFRKIAELRSVSAATEKVEADGRERFYKVTYVDADGLESPMPSRALRGQTLHKPRSPILKTLTYQGGNVHLGWQGRDGRIVRYEVQRHRVSGPILRDQSIWRIDGLSYTDSAIDPGTTYQYRIVGIDEHGIRSEPSELMRITVESSGVE